MLRAFILAAVICASCGIVTSMPAETLTVNRQQQQQEQPTTIINIKDDATFATTTTDTDTTITTTTKLNQNVTPSSSKVAVATAAADQVIDSNHNNENINNSGTQQQQDRYYHPAEDRKPRVIEEFNRQYLDGSYEYKYTLSNGVTRYEKSFWKPVVGKKKKILARKGFYSHPLKNQKYLTVFYTADENGYLQDTAKYTNGVPALPKHLDIPQMEVPQTTTIATSTTKKTTTTTTRKPKTTTTRKPKTTTTATTTWRPVVDPFTFNWIY